MSYVANQNRYENMIYKYSGNSGLKLPLISLGLWHNFSKVDSYYNMVDMITSAFDMGITHFDIANNYGMPYPGSAEINFGKILKNELSSHRDDIIISTKAGYFMRSGPYGDYGSRKSLISSLDASLKRMGIDYVDIFYHHRMDPDTPLSETMGALKDIVRSGKALYVGLSNYDAKTAEKAYKMLEEMGVHCLIHQVRCSLLDRHIIDDGTLDITNKNKVGTIVFSPLYQGILSDKYINGIPKNSRVANPNAYISKEHLTEDVMNKVINLNEIAKERNQTLSQMAISWLISCVGVTSVLVGASSASQIKENVSSTKNLRFTKDEIDKIEEIIKR